MSEPHQKPGRSKQDYGTPPEFLAAVKTYLGITEFFLDLAASEENAVAPSWLTVEQDALSKRWDPILVGDWNWLNPPYSRIGSWVSKAYVEAVEHQAHTAVLIPAAVGSNWWRDWVHEKASVLFLNPRLTFVGCKDPYPKDCALLLYEPHGCPRYDVWTWKEGKASDAVARAAGRVTGGPRASESSSSEIA